MSDQRTEQPTDKKLRDARLKGQVAKSRELGTALVVLATASALTWTGAGIVDAFRASFRLTLAAIEGRVVAAPGPLALACGALALRAVLPVLLAAAVAGTLASVLQTGPVFATDAVAPDLSRLDVFAGLGRLFTRKQAIELARSLVKIAIVGVAAWTVLSAGARGAVALVGRDAAATLVTAAVLLRALFLRAGGAMLALAIVDVFYQRWQFREDQKMTKEETKREHKESDGDPHTKGERERLRREISQHDLLERVRKADVLVVNPTHLAVALRYDEGDDDGAPEVLAKGQDELAQRMIAAAREAGVPVLRDVPLAHALHALDVDGEIPEALYEAVAAVLRAAWSERDAEGET